MVMYLDNGICAVSGRSEVERVRAHGSGIH